MRTVASLLLLLTGTQVAWAHGLEAGRGEAQLRDNSLFLVLAPSEALFLDLDRDGDGALQVAEVQTQRDALQARFLAAVQVTDARGAAPELSFFDVSIPEGLRPPEQRYLRFTAQLRWPTEPDAVVLGTSWAAERPLHVEAVRVHAARPGEWSARGPAEAAVLRPSGEPTRFLERPSTQASAPPLLWFVAAALFLSALAFSFDRTRAESRPGDNT